MDKRKVIFGLILIIVGLYFLGQTTDILWFDFGDISEYFLPLLFVGLGLWLIVRKKNKPAPPPPPPGGQSTWQTARPTPTADQQTTDSQTTAGGSQAGAGPSAQSTYSTTDHPHVDPAGKLKYDKFLGDLNVSFDGMSVSNVEVSSFIGDIEMRLHGAKLSPGLNRIVISGFIGDVRILVPHGLPIFVHGANFVNDIDILGQHISGFSNTLDAQSPEYSEADAKIYLAINTFIGDIRVYKV